MGKNPPGQTLERGVGEMLGEFPNRPVAVDSLPIAG